MAAFPPWILGFRQNLFGYVLPDYITTTKGWHDDCDCREAPECFTWAKNGWCSGFYGTKCPVSCKLC